MKESSILKIITLVPNYVLLIWLRHTLIHKSALWSLDNHDESLCPPRIYFMNSEKNTIWSEREVVVGGAKIHVYFMLNPEQRRPSFLVIIIIVVVVFAMYCLIVLLSISISTALVSDGEFHEEREAEGGRDGALEYASDPADDREFEIEDLRLHLRHN